MSGANTPRYPLLLATAAMGSILAPLNSTMLAVALPEIRDDFGAGHAAIGWLVSSYLIAMAVAQPLGGRLGDQLGRERVFRMGLVAFLGFSLAASIAPTLPVLILLRTAQALVGAAVIPNGIAMIRESVSEARLGQSGGFVGSALSTAAGVGPLLGGLLLAAGSWRFLFLVNLPLVLLALGCLAALRYPGKESPERPQIDWPGSLAFAVLLVLVTFLLNSLSGGESRYILAAAIVALIFFAFIFLRRQRRAPAPIVEWRLFRNRAYSGATMMVLCSNLVMYTTLLTIPFFIREVQDGSSAETGALLASMSLLMAVLAPFSGRLSDNLGRRTPALIGGVIVLVGVTWILAGLDRDVSFAYLVSGLVLLGTGFGLSFGAAGTAAIEAAPREMAGVAAGTNSMMRYVGSIVGAGVLGAVLSSGGDVPDLAVFRVLFATLVVFSVLALIAATFIHRFATPSLTRAVPATSDDILGSSVAP